jgi:hypothetical protein
MKIYKDLNIMVLKDRKLEIFNNYKTWFVFIIILSIIFSTLLIIKII